MLFSSHPTSKPLPKLVLGLQLRRGLSSPPGIQSHVRDGDAGSRQVSTKHSVIMIVVNDVQENKKTAAPGGGHTDRAGQGAGSLGLGACSTGPAVLL